MHENVFVVNFAHTSRKLRNAWMRSKGEGCIVFFAPPLFFFFLPFFAFVIFTAFFVFGLLDIWGRGAAQKGAVF